MNDNLARRSSGTTERPLRPRQGARANALDARRRTSAAISTSTATASATAPIPARTPTAGAFFTRGTSRDECAPTPKQPEAYVDNMERLQLKWETAADAGASPGDRAIGRSARHHLLRHHGPADDEALDRLAENAASSWTPCAFARFPFWSGGNRFHRRPRSLFVVEQNRDAQMRTLLINELGIDPSNRLHPSLRRILDHRPLSLPAGDRPISRKKSRPILTEAKVHHDVRREAEDPSPEAAGQRPRLSPGGTTRARSRRSAPAAVTIPSARRSCRPAPSCRFPPHRVRQSFRHRLLFEDAELLSRQLAWLQLRTGACPR